MKYSKPFPTLWVISVFIFASSCQAPKELEYRDFKNLKTEKLGFGNSILTVDLVYYNPNNFGIQLRSTDLDIFINDNYLGHSSQDFQVAIPKRAEFTLPLKVEIDTKNALKNVLLTLLNKEVTVKVTGKAKLGKGNVYKIFDVNYEGKQKFSIF